MNEHTLIRAIIDRVANPATRTDYVNRGGVEIGAVVTPANIEAGQRALKCSLHPLHRRLFEEVGNGGFGPGDGLVGLPGGRLDINGYSIIDLKRVLGLDQDTSLAVVPLCEWGDGIWSCVDSETGAVLTLSEFGLKQTTQDLHTWFEDWVSGINIWQRMVILENKTLTDPFTNLAVTVQVVTGIVGRQYLPRKRDSSA